MLPSSRKLSFCLTRKSRSSCLRRNGTSLRGGASDSACCQSRVVASFSSSSTLYPEAYRPPTTAPMLVPAMASMRTPCSSRALSTPMWARPRAAPPDSTRPTLGLAGSAANTVREVRVSRKQNSKRRIVSLKPWAKDR
ncbi:hypothetical protein D3C75_880050 [compost metagenome]